VQGAVVGVIGVSLDVSERLATEAALQQSEVYFRATFEQAAVGIAHIALDDRWLRVNQRLCAIVGYTSEELLQTTLQELTHPQDQAGLLTAVRSLVERECITHASEQRFIHKQGTALWVQVTIAAVDELPTAAPYLVAVLEDISDRNGRRRNLRTWQSTICSRALPNRLALSNPT